MTISIKMKDNFAKSNSREFYAVPENFNIDFEFGFEKNDEHLSLLLNYDKRATRIFECGNEICDLKNVFLNIQIINTKNEVIELSNDKDEFDMTTFEKEFLEPFFFMLERNKIETINVEKVYEREYKNLRTETDEDGYPQEVYDEEVIKDKIHLEIDTKGSFSKLILHIDLKEVRI